MKVAIDLTSVRSVGTLIYAKNLLSHINQSDSGNDYLVFASTELYDALEGSFFDERVLVKKSLSARKLILRSIYQQIWIPAATFFWGGNVIFSPFDIAPLLSPIKVVLAMRNPLPILNKYEFIERLNPISKVKGIIHRCIAHCSSLKAVAVSFPSIYASDEIGAIYSIPKNKRYVIYHGNDSKFWAKERQPVTLMRADGVLCCRYILFVSEFYDYKNPEVLFRAFGELLKDSRFGDVSLVLVGKFPDQERRVEVKNQLNTLGIHEKIIFLEGLSAENLASIYQHAKLFVMPTKMETFGFPYVEAISSGVPVAASNIAISREICIDSAYLFGVDDDKQLLDIIRNVLLDPSISGAKIEKGIIRGAFFDWERETAETIKLIESVA